MNVGGVQRSGGVQCKRRAACNALRVCSVKWEQHAKLWGRAMQKESGVQSSGGGGRVRC